ncbi:MAG: SDR family NAD(P)-dependent oxidoreductase [Candidatus Methanomethyliaceae archaeon]
MRTCLVTGGAGFIGSHIADRLIEAGYRVVIIDNESTGLKENVNPQAIYLKGDITRPNDLKKAFSFGIDAVFHIAGQASTIRSFNNPLNDLIVNVIGTLNILRMCLKYKVPRLMYASSMTVYGHPTRIPVPESEPCKPISYYGITKFAAERYIHATAERVDLGFDFHVTSFRMFNVYGERQSLENPYQGVVGIFIGNVLRGEPITIYSDGEQSRDFVYIQDVVEAWMAALDNEAAYEQVFNLGTGIQRSINELVDVILRAFGHSRKTYPIRYAPVRPGDQRYMAADITKAAQTLGWHPTTAFNDGMERTIRWAAARWRRD